MTRTKIVIAVVLGVIAIILVGYLAGPLFFNVEVNEELPSVNIANVMGNFVGVGDGIHDASGEVILIESNDGSRFIRFENFQASNGPDLYVYLATDETAQDFVNLGRLKGNIGNQNYMIPPGLEISKYDNVLIWCKQFSVLFGHAELS